MNHRQNLSNAKQHQIAAFEAVSDTEEATDEAVSATTDAASETVDTILFQNPIEQIIYVAIENENNKSLRALIVIKSPQGLSML